jgi:tetratricopeptide (TPR) repeat protein
MRSPRYNTQAWIAAALALVIGAAAAGPARAEEQTLSRKRAVLEWEKLNQEFSKAFSEKRNDEALRRANDSLKLAEQAFGPEDPAVAVSLGQLAAAQEATGDYSQIESLLQRALAIRTAALGPNHTDTAKSLTNLGRLRHFNHQYAEAESYYKRALATHESAQGQDRNDFAIANALHDLAVAYRDQGQYAKALECVKRELAIWDQKFGTDYPLALPIIDIYAEMARRTGDARKAESLEARAYRIRGARPKGE